MSDRPVLLVDVMDTLVYNPFNAEIPAYFGLTQEELLRQKHPTAWVEFETGAIDETEYLRRYFADFRTFDHVGFKRAVRSAYRFLEGMEALLTGLRNQDVPIHAFSNYPVWYREIEDELRLSRFLEWTFVSCLTGVRKPAREAYLSAARKLNRPPEACLFIDDSSANCRAATAIGMTAICFVDASSLWRDLVRIQVVK